jgi:phytoene desaturase
MPEQPVIVIGAGIGGLSAAIHLAAAGRRVLVLEQNPQVGGKMSELRQDGYRWDSGPSLITMRPAFEDLFAAAGRRLEDYLALEPVEPLTRCFFSDGSRLDLSRELPVLLEQIAAIERRDVEGYLAFLAYAARLYRITSPLFIFDQPPRLQSLFKAAPGDLLGFDGLRTMQQAIESYVRSPQMRQVLGMFATYVGASPYLAPAALNVIAHVELSQGLWAPRGGVYAIARAYARLAEELGVEIRTGWRVEAIQVENGRAVGVRAAPLEGDAFHGDFAAGPAAPQAGFIPAAAVVANLDVSLVYQHLLPPLPAIRRRLHSLLKAEPSCSCFVMLLGLRGQHPELAHHNEFFSADYRGEFEEIFTRRVPPSEPTLYLSISSRSEPGDAPPGCENWFVQINVPALCPAWDWSSGADAYAESVLDLLARRGLDVRAQIETRRYLTPADIAARTAARNGALYGASSNNRWAAFRRPHNRCPDVAGLYFAGGTTHPGGGAPMVTLSGKVASRLLLDDLQDRAR